MLDQHPLIAQNFILGGSQGQDQAQIPAARICVFDADVRLQDSLAQMLQQSGYTVIAGAYGEAAHAILRDGAFDLIVLNLESSGGVAAHALKSIRIVQPDVPLIVTAAHASAESAIAAIKANVVDYIVKPYEPSDLLLTISKALEERAQQLRQQQLLSMVSQTLETLKQSRFTEPAVR